MQNTAMVPLFPEPFEQRPGLGAKGDSQMQEDIAQDSYSTARKLRPVVIAVVASKLAVFALLMTTVNFQPPLPAAIEVAEAR